MGGDETEGGRSGMNYEAAGVLARITRASIKAGGRGRWRWGGEEVASRSADRPHPLELAVRWPLDSPGTGTFLLWVRVARSGPW